MKPKEISFLPDSPGCYLFRNKNKEIIYVGKAKNIKKRVSNYFQKKDLDPKTALLVTQIEDIDIFVTTSEVEALLLENSLIKKYYPRFNLDLKDSRRYAYLLLHEDKFPWLEVVRDRNEKGSFYGPFVCGAIRTLIFDVITRNFKILTKRASSALRKTINSEIYSERVEQVKKILEGNVDDLIKELETKMKESSSKTYYEYALTLRNQINALKTLKEKQLIEMHKTIELNIINYQVLNNEVYLLIFSIRKGILEEKQAYNFPYYEDFLEDFLLQYYDFALVPKEIIIPDNKNPEINITLDIASLEEYLSKKADRKVEITIPEKGDKKELLDLVNQNIDSTFFLGKDRITELKKVLGMEKLPRIIECFDISHLGGTNTVASMVCFKNGLPDKAHYRKFKIRAETNMDDYLAMTEVIQRRYFGSLSKSLEIPDLIVIDGGLGQLHAASVVLGETIIEKNKIQLISLAKRLEEIYINGKNKPLLLDRKNKGLQLLQSIRDEAHRFAITYQRKLRKLE